MSDLTPQAVANNIMTTLLIFWMEVFRTQLKTLQKEDDVYCSDTAVLKINDWVCEFKWWQLAGPKPTPSCSRLFLGVTDLYGEIGQEDIWINKYSIVYSRHITGRFSDESFHASNCVRSACGPTPWTKEYLFIYTRNWSLSPQRSVTSKTASPKMAPPPASGKPQP